MFVEFQQITFQNFLSYGNKPTTFEFLNGMNVVAGTNGSGKSVVCDALSFSLFGQPYRKIKISELVNRRNKKRLTTEILFKIDNNQYKIVRGIAPAKLEVYKNDEPIDLLASKKSTQSEIDKILGIDHNLFRQIISLAITHNRPFLSLPAGDKRDIIENIFGIKIFGEMLKTLKRNTSGVKIQTEISKKTIDLLENSIKGLKKQLHDTKIAIRDFEKNKKIDIKKIQDKIDVYNKGLNENESQIKKLKDNIITIDINEYNKNVSDYNKLKQETDQYKFELEKLLKDLKIISENDFCQSCKQEISIDHKNAEIMRLELTINKQRTDISEKTIKQESMRDDCLVIESHLEENGKILNTIHMVNEKLKFYKSEIESLSLDIDTIEKRKINFNVESIEKTLKEKSDEYVSVYKQYNEFVKASKTNDTISMILSEEGIKSYFFKKLLPLLNGKVNEVLNKFDLPLQITFNDLMEEEIHNYTNGNYVVNYYSLSEGEKKRIDIAILLAFISVTKVLSNWNCNLILMDELLDSSVDGDGLDKMIECLRSYISDAKNDICIYLISHRQIESQYFNNIYTIRKNHGFSEIEIKNS